jgi:hypothetical protein
MPLQILGGLRYTEKMSDGAMVAPAGVTGFEHGFRAALPLPCPFHAPKVSPIFTANVTNGAWRMNKEFQKPQQEFLTTD